MDNLQKLRFDVSYVPKAPARNCQMNLKLFEYASLGKKLIKEFPNHTYYNEQDGRFNFGTVQFTSDWLEDGNVGSKNLGFMVKDNYFEMDRKTDKMVPKIKDIAEIKFKVGEVLENAKT